MIKVTDLHKSFGDVEVLKGISTTFEQGKTNLIIGQSGSGKTVFLKCLLGLFDYTEGSIDYDDQKFTKLSDDQKRNLRSKIGMVFQGSALFDSMTIAENVMFPLRMFANLSESEMQDRANIVLKRVNLDNAQHKMPSEASGGMQKRVAIARAIVNNPKYLFCDEPNSGLDPKTAIVIDNLIQEITKEYNMVTVINSHDMNSVIEIGDNIIFIHEGQNWWNGDRNSIIKTDNKEINEFVYASEFMSRIKLLMQKNL